MSKILSSIVIVLVFIFCFCATGYIFSQKEVIVDWGVVVDKYYLPPYTTTHYVKSVPHTDKHEAEWHIVLTTENSGEYDTLVSRKVYRELRIGTSVKFSYTKCKIIGGRSGFTIIEIQ